MKLKHKFKNTFSSKKAYIYYLLGEGCSKGVVFLLLAFYTNNLTKPEFGTLSLFWVAVPLFSVLVDFSQRSYVKYYSIHNDKRTSELLYSLQVFSIFIALTYLIVFALKDMANIYIIGRVPDYYIVTTAALFAIIELHLSFFQIKGNYIKYNIVFVLRNAFPYILGALWFFCFSNSIHAFMAIQCLLLFGLSCYLFFSLNIKFPKFKTIREDIVNGLVFSFPFIPAMISVLALSFSDRFIINYFYSEVEVADYTVAYTISSVFIAFFMATNKMWQKYILENLKLGNTNKISAASKKYILLVASIGVLVYLFRSILLKFMSNESYAGVAEMIPILLLGMFFYFLYTVLSNIPFYHKNTYLMVVPAIIAAVINIILNFLLLPDFGYKIAAVTTTISYGIEFVIIYFICLSKYKTDILLNIKIG
ncbi:hypothetical protein EYD45_14690 [Hyunsoonleella flava]|uniref:Uncharacterized protein n=1 Tax=Hyunsoonleella flava TaxID=2527939 RepID=A0A4Q9FFV0_9FLAO|nr:polysaccharide biosynthesis C-terminal domain-containing protein [Hyunsoonleella flava]TBN00183.1 hypothetical protein EYD45_14690 [Hyunsoonleella flava]